MLWSYSSFFVGQSKIQEINSAASTSFPGSKNPLIVEINKKERQKEDRKRPEFSLFKNTRANKFVAKIKLPAVISGREVSLDVGEDRLILSSKNYNLDIFLPLKLNGAMAKARFIQDEQLLVVETPIIL